MIVKNIVYYAVDKDGRAIIHTEKPERCTRDFDSPVWIDAVELLGEIPPELSHINWENSPVKLELNIKVVE